MYCNILIIQRKVYKYNEMIKGDTLIIVLYKLELSNIYFNLHLNRSIAKNGDTDMGKVYTTKLLYMHIIVVLI